MIHIINRIYSATNDCNHNLVDFQNNYYEILVCFRSDSITCSQSMLNRDNTYVVCTISDAEQGNILVGYYSFCPSQ